MFEIVKRPVAMTGLEAALIRIYSILAGLAFVAVLFMINGFNPFEVYIEMIRVAFFTDFGLSQTLVTFIPLLLMGLGLAIPAKAQIDNIGAEGQFVMGALGAYWVAWSYPSLTAFVLIPLMLVVSFLIGALWALPMAIFRVKGGFRGADVVVSFLLVFPAQLLLLYLITNNWESSAGRGFPESDPLSDNAKIPILDFPSFVPVLGKQSDIHALIILAFVFVFAFNFLLFKKVNGVSKTKIAYEIEIVGKNQRAAKIGGINYMKIALLTSIISGGLAGIAGAGQLAGNQNNLVLRESISTNLGFTAIAVAWLGGLNPVGIIFSALLISGLLTGRLPLQGTFNLPSTTVDLLNGTILLFVLVSEFFVRFKIRSN